MLNFSFGFQDEWSDFSRRNARFTERWPGLEAAMKLAFERMQEVDGPVDRVVYFLGCICCEDLMEIMLLAGNGYGVGAQKILRGMYERAVTMIHLSQNPEEVDAFWNFHWIQQHKLVEAIKRTFGPAQLPQHIMTSVEEQYGAVKEQYRITACEACQTTRINHTWSKYDIVSMAHKAGDIGKIVVMGYYEPMSYSHSTAQSLMARLENLPEGLRFNSGAQPDEADDALRTAHRVILLVIDAAEKHFHLGGGLQERLEACRQDFRYAWAIEAEGDQDGPSSSSDQPETGS